MKKLFESKKKTVSVVIVIALIISIGYLYVKNNQDVKYYERPEYETLLAKAIADKTEEMEQDRKKEKEEPEWIIVTKEMESDPKYQDSEGIFDISKVCDELGISMEMPKGALKEKRIEAEKDYIKPHVLEGAEIAIYSDEKGEFWKLNKGDVAKFHVYVDTDYYKVIGAIYFGVLKDDEPFLVDNLKVEDSTKVVAEHEFEYTINEDGNYRFYIFRGSMDPIIIKWIDISID